LLDEGHIITNKKAMHTILNGICLDILTKRFFGQAQLYKRINPRGILGNNVFNGLKQAY